MANISEEKWIEILEKKADGSYIAKYPKVKSKSGITFDEHLADYASFKNNIEAIRYVDEKMELKINGEWVEFKVFDLKLIATPSDTVRSSAPKAHSLPYGNPPAKVKEIRIGVSGVVRTKFEMWLDGAGSKCYGRIYINDEPVGTERVTTSTNIEEFTEDIEVSEGDLIQLYAWATGGPGSVRVREFKICYDVELGLEVSELDEIILD